MGKHLIKPSDVQYYARPCDMDEAIVERAIEEAEQLDIKPKIGDALFMRMIGTPVERLIAGGEYTDISGNARHFTGLRQALAYYTWARLVKTGANRLTRFGYVQKRDEHSHASELRERQASYNDAFAVADGYMNDCLTFLMSAPGDFPDYTLKGCVKANRTKFKVIGD